MESITQYIKPEDDYFYIKGKQEVIVSLLQKTDFSNEQIAEIVNVQVDLVERVRKEQGKPR